MTTVRWISFILAIAGVLECSGIKWGELNFHSSGFLFGNLMIFLSINGSAFYNAYSKKVLDRFSPLQVLLYSYYAVFLFMLPIALYAEPYSFKNLPDFTAVVWFGLIALAVFQYLLSMVIFLTVLTRLDATQAALSNYLIPFFGIIIAAIVLHEHLTTFVILGGGLVLASTLLITVYEERKRISGGSALGPSQKREQRPGLVFQQPASERCGSEPPTELRPGQKDRLPETPFHIEVRSHGFSAKPGRWIGRPLTSV